MCNLFSIITRHRLGGGGEDSAPIYSREPKVVERWARRRWIGLTETIRKHAFNPRPARWGGGGKGPPVVFREWLLKYWGFRFDSGPCLCPSGPCLPLASHRHKSHAPAGRVFVAPAQYLTLGVIYLTSVRDILNNITIRGGSRNPRLSVAREVTPERSRQRGHVVNCRHSPEREVTARRSHLFLFCFSRPAR